MLKILGQPKEHMFADKFQSREFQRPQHSMARKHSERKYFLQTFGKHNQAPLRVHVSQADGWLLFLDKQALGLIAGDRNCGYRSLN